jgi:tryptophanyl-tRNA synthetase
MLDGPDVVRRKVSRAVTDSDAEVRYDPAAKPGVSNLLDIVAVLTHRSPADVAAGLTGYGALKAQCVDAVVAELEPIQRRYAALVADPDGLDDLLAAGAERAARRADAVVDRARRAVGLLPARQPAGTA